MKTFLAALFLFSSLSAHSLSKDPIGKFGELSLATEDIEHSITYWKSLGFKLKGRYDQPYPWAILKQGKVAIGLHQTSDWTGPTLTYFDREAADRISSLEKSGVKMDVYFRDAEGKVTGAGFRSPEGQKIFLFNGDCK
ncbi:MAG: hypothetical protein HYV97_02675 [Bdellovibrio sp.]|nr:hypothetical protein [Bdellovibrio sp.]